MRRWARALVACYPPSFRRSVGEDLVRLLVDGGRAASAEGSGRLAWYLIRNSVLGVRDALVEWAGVVGETTTRTGRELMNGSGWYGFRLTVKGLARRPGYALPVLLTLTLGIGANTAMFTVLDSVVLRPLPYPDVDRIVRVAPVPDVTSAVLSSFSLPDARDWEARSATLAALGAYQSFGSGLVYTGGGEALEIPTAYVTAGFYRALGVEPMLGRLPTADEEMTDNRVVVVSHDFWRQQLGADPAAVGSSLPLSGQPYTVAGVMPPSFDFPSADIGVWAFLTTIRPEETPYHIRGVRLLSGVARLADGVTLEQARADLSSVASGLAAEYPESNERLATAAVTRLQDDVVGDARVALFVLMGAAGLILLITWANLANLALAREAGRAPELAVRAALGASGARRVGLVVTESVVLAVMAGILGMALAVGATDVLTSLGGGVLPRAHEITPDWRVALFTLVVALVTGVVIALLASGRAGRADLATSIRTSGRGLAAGAGRGVLIVSQIALSVVLLVGAVLLVRTLESLGRVDVGFRAENLVVADMTFAPNRFPDREDFLPRFDAMREALATVPGVRSVSSIRRFPFRGIGERLGWTVPGAPQDQEPERANLLQVGPNLFESMGIPFVEGSDFGADDRTSGRYVAVVGERVARTAYPGERAVGRTLVVGGVEIEIVGVVDDIRQTDLRSDPVGVIYLLNDTNPRRGAAFVVRTEPGAGDVLPAIREAVRRVDPAQPITELASATTIVGQELGTDRFLTLLLTLFAGLALTLSAVGVYAVVSFGVSRRRREVGIRLALGAEPAGVRALVVRQGMRPVVAGVVVGASLAALATRALERMLFGVEPSDPAAYVGAIVTLGAIGLLACWLPARGAARASAMDALATD